ncbi:MAG: S8 family serine peptidase [Actinomycetia bacterium]|nr:S8 family serine peptidase [Actinomycetes bacterium]
MRRSILTLLSVFALAIAVLAPLSAAGAAETPTGLELAAPKAEVAKSPNGSYIIVMKAEPLIVEFGQDGLDTKQADKARAKKDKKHDEVLAESGASASDKVNSYTNAVDGFSALVSHSEAQAMANRDDVLAVYPDELRQTTTDSSPTFLRLDDPKGPWADGYDGEGIVIGVIDTGIWPEHASFADDGSYPAPPNTLDDSLQSACDFGNTAANPLDAPFTCNNKLIGARQMLATYRALVPTQPFEYDSARDDNGHGTHTASTSGGNADVQATIFDVDRGIVSGIAPRAHIIMYKGLGTLGGFGSDLAAAIDQAVFDGVDVINYSIGSGSFAIGPDDVAFLFAADAGVFVATSNGNNGPGAATTGSPASVPWLTSVGASTQARTFQGTAVLGDGSEYFGASVTAGAGPATLIDSADAGSELCVPGALDPLLVAGNIVLCKRGAIARVAKSEAVSLAGGIGMILYNVTDAQEQVTDNHWVPSVHTNNTDGLAIKDYIASDGAGATAEIIGGVYTTSQGSVMAAFSSRGPNGLSGDIIKPDVTAPGVNILAGNTPTPEPGSVPGELFQAISGTSMSSPHVAGMFALIKQAHPDWSAAMAKSALMTTSRQDVTKEDATTAADPFDMGAGHITAVSQGNQGSPFDPGLVYDAGLFEYVAFTCGADLGIFTPGSCAFMESLGIPTDPSDLNVPSIGIADLAGTQTIVRTVTNVTDKKLNYQASVKKPKGFDVKVNPSHLRLQPGESATVEITITNKSAIPNTWEFGELTWHGGGYQVTSPIAVKAALFSAPDVVPGTGTDGSASFDVIFGYTGDYTAAPHGLSANAPTSGEISQDPDTEYPSDDDGDNGGVVWIDFTVTDSGMVRWSMVIPGDDDVDLFLHDSSGAIIATSTNGGTDELIELVLPADDTYTMAVHGWGVPNEPLPFTLNYWNVPLASGGSLSVDSAPASAVAGAVEPIDISWSGLTAGTSYLGAVSHSDASGFIGFTTVEVDG